MNRLHHNHDRERLLELLKAFSYERRPVTLASGKQSDFYLDCRQTALTPEGHFLIGRLLLAEVRATGIAVEAVGGMTLGADPLASAVSLTSYLGGGSALGAFIVRKDAKAHGTAQLVEGLKGIRPGASVALLEDVVTTGASALRAAESVRQVGLKPEFVCAVVDRGDGGREALAAAGLPLRALFTAQDFL